MPTNRLIYFGTLIIAASVLVWVGAELTRRIEWLLPYTAGAGIVLLVAGVLFELYRWQQSRSQERPE